MEELWRDIPGYEGLYQASNLGRIRSAPGKTTSSARYKVRVWKTRIICPKKEKRCRNSNGYTDERVELWKDGTHKTMLVSRLVAMAWVPGFSDEMTVNHINGNPLDNSALNLEWVTREENIKKAFETGLYRKLQSPVILTSALGKEIQFQSKSEASRFLGHNSGYIANRQSKGRRYGYDEKGQPWWFSH